MRSDWVLVLLKLIIVVVMHDSLDQQNLQRIMAEVTMKACSLSSTTLPSQYASIFVTAFETLAMTNWKEINLTDGELAWQARLVLLVKILE